MRQNHFLFCAFSFLFSANLIAQSIQTDLSQIPVTTISFEETEYDFGQAVVGEKVWYTFKFTNTGAEPLLIYNAKGSCGCTVPRWPKDPVAPGESGEIFAVFDTKNKRGRQTKAITLTVNTEPNQIRLYVKGEVLTDEESLAEEYREEDYIEFKLEDENRGEESFTAYPNPTVNNLNLSLQEFLGQSIFIEIYNSTGHKMDSRNIASISSDLVQLDVSAYDGGIYSVTILTEDGKRISKQFLVVK